MSAVTDVLDELEIPYKVTGWEPKNPPRNTPYYAVIDYVENDIGSDFNVMYRRISALVTLYDFGTTQGIQMRDLLHDALSDANLKHTRTKTDYFKDEKVFMTEYDLEDYIEKRRF